MFFRNQEKIKAKILKKPFICASVDLGYVTINLERLYRTGYRHNGDQESHNKFILEVARAALMHPTSFEAGCSFLLVNEKDGIISRV